MKRKILSLFASLLVISGCSQKSIDLNDLPPKIEPDTELMGKFGKNINLSTSINSFSHDSPHLKGLLNMNDFKKELLIVLNDIRSHDQYCSRATRPLAWDDRLQLAAQSHVLDLVTNNLLRHNGSSTDTDISRNGSSFIERIKHFGFPLKPGSLIGENIVAVKTTKTKTDLLFPNLKRSLEVTLKDPPHCKILMEPRFNKIGMGIYHQKHKYIIVMDFGEEK